MRQELISEEPMLTDGLLTLILMVSVGQMITLLFYSLHHDRNGENRWKIMQIISLLISEILLFIYRPTA